MSTVISRGAQPATAAPMPPRVANPVVRWFAALILIVYGFAKLNGAQFTILDSELDKPMVAAVAGFFMLPASLAAQEQLRPGTRPDCWPPDMAECWRQNEQAFMDRWPGIATRSGDTLTIRLDDWGELRLVDNPAIGDRKRRWAFRGVTNGSGILVDELSYEEWTFWLIDRMAGTIAKFPCAILPSDDGRWVFCEWHGFDDMVMSRRGVVRIYRLNYADAPVLEAEHNLGPFKAVRPRWVGYGRIEFGVAYLTGEREGRETGCTFTLDYSDNWRFPECVR